MCTQRDSTDPDACGNMSWHDKAQIIWQVLWTTCEAFSFHELSPEDDSSDGVNLKRCNK